MLLLHMAGETFVICVVEAGSSIVASPSMPIRSRFARFDPRLKHLRNLSAGVGALGLLGISQSDIEEIEQYLEGI